MTSAEHKQIAVSKLGGTVVTLTDVLEICITFMGFVLMVEPQKELLFFDLVVSFIVIIPVVFAMLQADKEYQSLAGV
jgi:hypothetical protein